MDLNTMIALMAASIYPAMSHEDVQTRIEESVERAKQVWAKVLKKDK